MLKSVGTGAVRKKLIHILEHSLAIPPAEPSMSKSGDVGKGNYGFYL
jgi:hypothetical protein